jgi:hypothetical protein
MANFARSLPHNAINNPSDSNQKKEVTIEAQHQKWAKHLRHVQMNNRRARTSILGRIDEYSNIRVAIFGSIITSLLVAATIATMMMLGF